MKAIIAAIHGILTNQTDPSWPDQFDAWMFERDPEVKVLKKEYHAGPFPRWNCWVKDPLLARSLANELDLFFCPSTFAPRPSPPPVWLVAHSNGAVIALLTAKILIARGHRIAGLILTGAACDADIDRNGVLEWQCRGMLGSAIAYSSAEDHVLPSVLEPVPSSCGLWSRFTSWLWRKCIWPYGCLGQTGWMLDDKPVRSDPLASASMPTALFTRWFSGGHSGYFAKATIARTFSQIYRDIKTAEPQLLCL